jgi:hypothetical protein
MSAPTLISTASSEVSEFPEVNINVTKGQFVMAFLMLQESDSASISDTNSRVSWNLLQTGTFDIEGRSSVWVWYGTAISTGNTTVQILDSNQSDLIVNVYSSAAIDVFSAITTGVGVSVQSVAINTNIANELIVGWCGSTGGLSTSTPAGPPYTFDQSIPATTLNGTESDTVSETGSFQSNFTTQGSSAKWASGVIGLLSLLSISGNAGVAGALITYSGSASGSVVADGSGNFTISGLEDGGSFTITPSLTNYSFSPTSANETLAGSNIAGVNFTSTANAISGNAGVAGAIVSYTGPSSGSVTADGSGNYVTPALGDGSYTITPSLTNTAFTPSSRVELVSGAAVTGVNFTATSTTTFSISGKARVPGAIITFSGTASGSTIADANGLYSIGSLQNGSYTITTPTLTGYTFHPLTLSEVVSNANIVNADFAVTLSPTRGTIVLGQFSGSGDTTLNILMSAFPQNKRQLDLMQIKNPMSGLIIWKLDYAGNITVNPTSSTNGTVLGQFLGSSWNECFVENNTNPYAYDLIQIVSLRGGNCLWLLDHTGTIYSVN